MKILKALYEKYFDDTDKEQKDSDEFISQRNKCIKLYDDLAQALTDEQKKKLLELDNEHFMPGGICNDDGIEQGIQNGFKLLMKLLIESII